MEWKDYKSQINGFAERLCLLVMSAATATKSHQDDCPNKDNTNGHDRVTSEWMGESPQASTLQKVTIGN